MDKGEEIMEKVSLDKSALEIIKDRLGVLISGFNPAGCDRKLLAMAIEDFNNFLSYSLSQGQSGDIETYVVYKDDGDVRVDSSPLCINPTNPEKIEEKIIEIEQWVDLWLGKWKERVNLVFSKDSWQKRFKHQDQSDSRFRIKKWFIGHEEVKEFKEPVIRTLIAHGELVGTEVLSKALITLEAAKLKGRPRTNRDRVMFMSNLLKEVRAVAGMSGVLIYLLVEGVKYE